MIHHNSYLSKSVPMKKFYLLTFILFFVGFLYLNKVSAQLSATVTTYESRCAATGAIKISASGGSGSYQYKTEGPVNTNYTNQDSITGLSSGTYSVIINDIVTNNIYKKTGVVVGGTYADPRFSLSHIDVSCDNGYNGSIIVENLQNGRYPFTYSIVAPSAMGVGTSNTSGIFNNLKAGNYSIMLADSCGGIQTRTVTVNNYTWNIDSYNFTKLSCDNATGFITVKDSKGNDSKYTTIPGFSYGVVLSPGDTTWSADGNFNISATGLSSIEVFAKDACGTIKKVTLSAFLIPSLDANVNLYNKLCNTFSASVTGIKNFFNPDFSLYDSDSVKIADNTSGNFTNIPYGKYCIKAHDGCSDSIITRCFEMAAPIASVSSNITISNKTCLSFSATIKGQQNLTNPTYCIINSNNDTLSCNSSGGFDNLSYGDYCIVIKDGCIDTTLSRCFSVTRPIPKVQSTITPSYVTCTNFGIRAGGDSLTNPTYCLYDTSHNLVGVCNNTGIFDSIPLGSYCITIHDACLDTTITRCFDVGAPTVANDINIKITDKNCESFTASVETNNLSGGQFCLYKKSDSSLVICNTSGVFSGLLYGDYYIKSRNSCPDTTMVNSFSVIKNIPSVDPNVSIYNRSCNSFTAEITNQQNLISPVFCIIDVNTNDTLECNSNGRFNNVPYGSYLVQVLAGCDDTLKIPFSSSPSLLQMNVTAQKSCYYNYSKFNVSITGVLPVNIKIYDPGDNLIRDKDFSVNNFSIDSIPELNTGMSYTIIGTDGCGKKDTFNLAPVIGYLQHTTSVAAKCPGSIWPNGSGDLKAVLTTNLPSVSVKIIRKDNANLSPQLSPTTVDGSNYIFNDLGPGVYVVRYKANDGCGVNLYDTVTIQPYLFPNLSRSSAYQCDVNGFSIGAVVSGGVGPFTYEIIGSVPSLPSLTGSPQSDPVFNINNGTTYSLIRLRALDACGNATLADASILPLADNGIKATSNCLQSPVTLSVDTIYNSTYSWFFKRNEDAQDSIAMSNQFKYYIPDVMPTDTGIYICDIKVNNGCINRTYYFHLNGSCYTVLPMELESFSGRWIEEKILLNWAINNPKDLKEIIIERKSNSSIFKEIGKINLSSSPASLSDKFTDEQPGSQNFYRIKLIKNNNTSIYSNIIFLQKKINRAINIYPNPASDILNAEFYQSNGHTYIITLSNMLNQKIKQFSFNTGNGNMLQIKRSKEMTDGTYILQFTDVNTGEQFSEKVIFTSK